MAQIAWATEQTHGINLFMVQQKAQRKAVLPRMEHARLQT
jgi:hypothetical protein